jgi:hypothetical protein
MSKNRKVKVFEDYTDAHMYGFWNFTVNNKQYKVTRVNTPRKGWAVLSGK